MIGEDPDLNKVTRWGLGFAQPAKDFTFKVVVGGLRPDTTYYYRFWAEGESSELGRTRTLPAGSVERLRFAVASCANYPAGYFSAARAVDRSKFDMGDAPEAPSA